MLAVQQICVQAADPRGGRRPWEGLVRGGGGSSDGFGAVQVWAPPGLGLARQCLACRALPQGWQQRDRQVPGCPCPETFGTQEGVGRHLACVEVWPCHAPAVACPVGPPAASMCPVRGLPPPAWWHVPGPAEGCHQGCCRSEVMQQGAVGAAPPGEEKPIGVVWDTLQQGWSSCGV